MNSISNKKVFKWEIAGIFFLIIVGSLLHFTYKWSNYNPFVGMFSPINESVWEHLKLGFTSLFLFSIIEYFYIKNISNNFLIAKALGIIALELFIIIVFYTYTTLLGTDLLIIDILSFVVGCVICQIISYNILIKNKFNNKYRIISGMFLIAFGISFIIFTFNTPRLPIFKDSNTNSYGTDWNIDEREH